MSDREFSIAIFLTVTAEDEDEAREWGRSFARDLFGLDRVLGVTCRVSELEEDEVDA